MKNISSSMKRGFLTAFILGILAISLFSFVSAQLPKESTAGSNPKSLLSYMNPGQYCKANPQTPICHCKLALGVSLACCTCPKSPLCTENEKKIMAGQQNKDDIAKKQADLEDCKKTGGDCKKLEDDLAKLTSQQSAPGQTGETGVDKTGGADLLPANCEKAPNDNCCQSSTNIGPACEKYLNDKKGSLFKRGLGNLQRMYNQFMTLISGSSGSSGDGGAGSSLTVTTGKLESFGKNSPPLTIDCDECLKANGLCACNGCGDSAPDYNRICKAAVTIPEVLGTSI